MRRQSYLHAVSQSLTRISVSSKGDVYTVRNGDERPVLVRFERGELRCECGERRCAHVESLRLCGFIEPAPEQARAA